MSFTRRDLLTAFLGAPLALAACRRSARARLPPGELVGTSDVVGHRLREGWRPEPREGDWKRVRIAIVGGGIAGLAAAWRLRKAGIDDFAVFELEPAAGGTSRSGESVASRIPWGAHYVPAPTRDNPALVALLDEMGLIEGTDVAQQPVVREEALVRDPDERLFFRGTWYEGLYLHAGATAEDLRQLASFHGLVAGWVRWRDVRGRRAFTIPMANCSDDAEVTALDRITMRDWLDRNGFTSSRLRWYVEYACRDDYGTLLESTSAWAGIFYFASRVPAPNEEGEPLVTWPEGNGRFVDHFLRSVGSRLHLSNAVTDVAPREGGASVITASADGRSVVGYHAERVIFAGPQFLAARVVKPLRDEHPSYLREFVYGAWMVANIALRDRPTERTFPLAWDNVSYESPSLGYVVATHQLDLERGPTTFTYYYALCDDDASKARGRLLAAGRDEWAEIALTDLSMPHPEIRDLALRADVMRWGHAMIRPRPGFVWSGARRLAAQPRGPIHFASTDLSGIALFEEAFFHGVRAADEVVAALRG